MKNLALIFSILFVGFSAQASSPDSEENYRRGYDGSAYIFVEGDVEFSVFPDGQFDFVYIGPQKGSRVTINTPNVNISFNSGYDYDAYVQYDDYGAVIQVENVPIYYDYYGRISRAGNVEISYNDRRIVRVGGLHIFYTPYGHFSHCTGAINVFNPYYVYRPWHVYYAPPVYSHCIVYDMPYRRYYRPVRYSYHDHIIYYKNRHRVAYHNGPRDFYRPGSRVYDKRGRARINKNYNPNRRNTMVAHRNTSDTRNTRSHNVRNTQERRSSASQARSSRGTHTRSGEVKRTSSSNSKGATRVDRPGRSKQKVTESRPAGKARASKGDGRYRTKESASRQVKPNRERTRSSVGSNRVKKATSQRTVSKKSRQVSQGNRGHSTVKRSAPSRKNTASHGSRSHSKRNSHSSRGRG